MVKQFAITLIASYDNSA